jgi:hypothetical protein
MLRSLDSDLVLQARFKKLNAYVSVNRGFVARVSSTSPVVQLTMPENNGNPILYIDFVVHNVSQTYEDDEISFTPNAPWYVLQFKKRRLSIQILVNFGQSLDFRRISLSKGFRKERVVGLLGKVDDDSSNDWMLPNGTSLKLPTNYMYGEVPYEYCTSNWCIADPSKSLFVYDQGLNFEYYYGCDEAYGGLVDVSGASAELRDLCGIDEECLTDGVEIDLTAGQSVLESKAQVLRASSEAQFRIFPTVLVVNAYYNVTFTVNFSTGPATDTASIEGYAIYQLQDSQLSRLLVTANDLGLAGDEFAADRVFTGVTTIQGTVAGASLDFQAVPVINGEENPLSRFVFNRFNGAVCFSIESKIGTTELVALGTENYGSDLRVRIYTGEYLFTDQIIANSSAPIQIRVALSVDRAELLDAEAIVSRAVNCLTGSCRLEEVTAVLTIDVTGLPSSGYVYIVLKTGELLSPFRYVYNAGGTLHQLEVLALPNITVSVYEYNSGEVQYDANNIDCSSGICSAGNVTSNLSVNLVGLSTNTYVNLLDTGSSILRQLPDQGGSIQSYPVICGISYQIDVLSELNTLIRRYISNICICGGSCTLTSIVV